jgi:tyrosyl-tRNA synthetase
MTDPGLLDDLRARGLVHDTTDEAELSARLAEGPITVYSGFDPTADSLHIGNLVPLLLLRRFQEAGHRPIALAGGATGMIGDPGGRSEERQLLEPAQLDANLAGIRTQLERVLDLSGDALLVDNRTWTEPVSVLEFLRDVGKHMTVNAMLAKESVKARVTSEHGISFTEFSYMLLQANDYLWLHEHEGCELQIGGSDQWGNITAGIDLIRRRTGAHVHGLTVPLVTRSDGQKFGKSQEGNVWLSADRTSPYRFYQYWMQLPDADLDRFLRQLTLLPVDEVTAVVAEHAGSPERRLGQRRLASEVTTLVHGPEAAAAAAEAAAVLFGGDGETPSAEALAMLADEIPTSTAALGEGVDLVELLAGTDLASSKSDARRALDERSIWVNGRRLDGVDEAGTVGGADLAHGRYLLLRRGKKRHHLVVAPT